MGKSREVQDINRQASDQYNYDVNKRNSYDPLIQGEQARANEAFGNASDAYKNAFAGLGDFTGAANSLMGGGPPVDVSALKGDASTWRNFAQGNTETGKFYRNLMDTGGYTPEMIANMSAEGNSTIPAFFENLRNQYASSQAATGGYSPGYGASLAKMSRESAREAQDAARRTQMGIDQSVEAGKERGAGGLEREFTSGMQGASQDEIAALQGLLQGRGQDIQSRIAGAGMLGDAGRLALGIGQGFTGLGEATPSGALAYGNQQNQYTGNIGNNISQRMGYNPNQSWFDKYGMPILGAGAGIFGSMIGGNGAKIGRLGSKPGSYGNANSGWSGYNVGGNYIGE